MKYLMFYIADDYHWFFQSYGHFVGLEKVNQARLFDSDQVAKDYNRILFCEGSITMSVMSESEVEILKIMTI